MNKLQFAMLLNSTMDSPYRVASNRPKATPKEPIKPSAFINAQFPIKPIKKKRLYKQKGKK